MNTPIKYVSTMASGLTSSVAVDLGAAYDFVGVEIPTFASGGTHYVQVSSDGSTFRRAWHMVAGVGTVFQLAPTVSQAVIQVPSGYQYYKVENTTGCTDVVNSYNFICFKAGG